jgi:hypothetical protein
MVESPATPRRPRPFASPVSAAEIAATRQPTTRAHLLPGRVFHDPDIFAYEQEAWFGGGWVSVGR